MTKIFHLKYFFLSRISVRLGEYDYESEIDCEDTGYSKECAPPPLDVPVVEKIAHENYNPLDSNQYHDIALLRLARDVTFSCKINYSYALCRKVT